MKIYYLLCFWLMSSICSNAQIADGFTHQDTLRGSIGKGRLQWDVLKYDITIEPDFSSKYLQGSNTITYFDSGIKRIQVDLQAPLKIDSIFHQNKRLDFFREGNVFWVDIRDPNAMYKIKPGVDSIKIFFSGNPKIAKRAPWDGGWIFTNDDKGRPWMTVACQGLGASVWYPCKDTQADEPDSGAVLRITTPPNLIGIGNGRLKNVVTGKEKNTFVWQVVNPINNYNIVPYIGAYVNFNEKFPGEKGLLEMDYWVLDYNLEKAKIQFTDANKMMQSFEKWFGPFPFYEDSYKLVEAPHLGMEHQSNIAYGNKFQMGYNGRDLSESGWGLKWDFIIVHESGHEWFGNNITSKDIADMWIHESFTHYSETLFVGDYFGKDAATAYIVGVRINIENDMPIIGKYGVNKEGSSDMYYKGGNMLHLIRMVIDDDGKFRLMLREMNKRFYHQTITTQQIEQFINEYTGINFSKVFDQYLRTTKVPTIEYKVRGKKAQLRFVDVVDDFALPVKMGGLKKDKILLSTKWQKTRLKNKNGKIELPADYYFLIKNLLEN